MSSHNPPSGRVSEVRPATGRPPPPPPPVWKGMGPARYRYLANHQLHTTTTTTNDNTTNSNYTTTINTTTRRNPCTTRNLEITSSSLSSLSSITSTRSHIPFCSSRVVVLFFALYSLLAWVSVSGFSLQSTSHCQIDVCFEQYNSATDALELSAAGVGGMHPLGPSASTEDDDTSNLDMDSVCVALRTYWSCVKNSSRGCQGDIRYYSVRNGVKSQMQQYNCTLNGPTVDPSHQSVSPPRHIPSHCQYRGEREMRHCGLFGDPHLRTFTHDFQTCKVKGAWPLVNNDYLTVQVTNHPVLAGQTHATATTKLTVIVKSEAECGSSKYHTYQAQTDELPGSFQDGNTALGPYSTVQLREVDPNRHVEIDIHYIATTIIIRQIGRYFTFAIHTPKEIALLGESSQEPELCSKGCPDTERIDYQRYLADRKHGVTQIHSRATGNLITITRQEAEVACRDAGLVDFYFDSCVFDLLATGDRNLTLAAVSALQDVVRLDPGMAFLDNRTSLTKYDDKFSAASTLCLTPPCYYLMCVLSLCLTFWQGGWGSVR